MNCRELIYSRARIIAERLQMDPKKACQSLTPVGVNGTLVTGATGITYNTEILDALDPAAVAGDHVKFTAKGSQKYLLLGLFDDSPVAPGGTPDWGYRGFQYNGNDVKNNFEGSFGIDAVRHTFFNFEAVRSGIEAFPWECMGAFGPNDEIAIGFWNRSGIDLSINLLGYALPIGAREYKPAFTKDNPTGA